MSPRLAELELTVVALLASLAIALYLLGWALRWLADAIDAWAILRRAVRRYRAEQRRVRDGRQRP